MTSRRLEEVRCIVGAGLVPASVRGVAIAGSWARGTPEEESDLDLFVILEPDQRIRWSTAIDECLTYLPRPLLRRGPVVAPLFGDSVTLVMDDLGVIQLNFATFQTLELNPMRANSRVVYDPTGQYARFVERAGELEFDYEGFAQRQVDHFLIRALFAARSLQRGQLVRASEYIGDCRTSLVSLLRLRDGVFDPRTDLARPTARAERALSESAIATLARTYGRYDVTALGRAIVEASLGFERLVDELNLTTRYQLTLAEPVLAEIRKVNEAHAGRATT